MLAYIAKVSDHKHLKILTPKQMLQRLPITLAQVKAGNTAEIRQIIYSLYRAKEITKKVYNNIMNSIQKMKSLFMNSKNSHLIFKDYYLIFQIK